MNNARKSEHYDFDLQLAENLYRVWRSNQENYDLILNWSRLDGYNKETWAQIAIESRRAMLMTFEQALQNMVSGNET